MIAMLLAVAVGATAPADTVITLDAVTVTGQRQRDYQMRSSQSAVQVSKEFLEHNFAGSLMQTLEGIPGVKAMSIGSGQSKPTIRGLGFNRLAVSEDGIKHEGQQWGDDHGLEIDQFSVDRAEVIKGPAALLYGSDAIGGVLSLYTNHVPTEQFAGTVQLFGRSNNEQLGLSAKVGGRQGSWFYRANATLIDYADFRVPTDSIQYYSYWIRLKDQRLRNTAGCERDGSVMLGYAGYNFHTDLRISDAYSRSGFFANAHGLEVRLSNIDYDHSRRDIDLPYQWVNHLKVLSHTTWRNEQTSVEVNVAYQNNLREELSEPVSHGYMPKPDDSLERRFNKSTYTVGALLRHTLGRHALQGGLNAEYQHNRRGGWGFIIPDFETASIGAYLMDRYTLRENLILNAGLRLDGARTHIHSYHDWYTTPVANADGTMTPVYTERSASLRRNFSSFTWSAGINYNIGEWVIKGNVGKSFRVPIPKELGADGINYHIFRYERGNQQLDPEESYQLDASVNWSNEALELQVEPYLNYFPNYIYLSPTSQYVEGLQLYHYMQARVLRYGLEAQLTYHITPRWEAHAQGEYLYARQRSGEKKGYTLPFTTPWSTDWGVKYSFGSTPEPGFVSLNAHIVGKQSEIVPPEKPTDGYWTLNLALGKSFRLGRTKLHATLHADNLLDRRYYDHTSYYRLIDVPEPGRNVSAMVGLEF
ncbi:MAG: TonB-dependent receptor [Prevotella sp.]|nr:TonB-dependent receptor [Prevotella sp.]